MNDHSPDRQPQAQRPLLIERAFELARSGSCRSVAEVAARLKRENYEAVDAHLAGPSLRRDLKRAWEADRAAPSEPPL